MSLGTAIEWADDTFNPWWGCTKVSPACAFCYAQRFAERLGLAVWGGGSPRRLFGPKHWDEPRRWDRRAAKDGIRRRVFCGSMCDVFEDRRDLDAQRMRLWTLVQETPHLDWLLLTKRPENVTRMVPWGDSWPDHVWLGVTVENQEWAAKRIPILVAVPAHVRFLSVEPLLGPVLNLDLRGIDWVIVGAESGPGARPMELDWARQIRDTCRQAGVALFLKQLGGWPDKRGGVKAVLDGRTWREVPIRGRPVLACPANVDPLRSVMADNG